MIFSAVECWATWISMDAPYSIVFGKASFIVLGYFIFFILWLVVGVVICLAGEDLPPPPFFIIKVVHGQYSYSRRSEKDGFQPFSKASDFAQRITHSCAVRLRVSLISQSFASAVISMISAGDKSMSYFA